MPSLDRPANSVTHDWPVKERRVPAVPWGGPSGGRCFRRGGRSGRRCLTASYRLPALRGPPKPALLRTAAVTPPSPRLVENLPPEAPPVDERRSAAQRRSGGMAGGSRFELATAQAPADATDHPDRAPSTASSSLRSSTPSLASAPRASSRALDPRRWVCSGPAGARLSFTGQS